MDLIFHQPKFEKTVRDSLDIDNRAITVEDAQKVRELDLSEIYLLEEDIETLFCFENLRFLVLDYKKVKDASFWNHFPMLEELFWEFSSGEDQISFEMFSGLSHLEYLYLSGGDLASTRLVNLEALIPLKNLKSIVLFEFGTIDLAPLERMTQLWYFCLDYPDSVENVEVLTRMDWLEEITWYDISDEDLECLKKLSKGVKLEFEY